MDGARWSICFCETHSAREEECHRRKRPSSLVSFQKSSILSRAVVVLGAILRERLELIDELLDDVVSPLRSDGNEGVGRGDQQVKELRGGDEDGAEGRRESTLL